MPSDDLICYSTSDRSCLGDALSWDGMFSRQLPILSSSLPCSPCLMQTPEQQQHLNALRYLIARPLDAAHNLAVLTALTASYRDLYVVMDQMHKRDILGIPRPLVDGPPPSSSASLQEQQQLQPPVASISELVQQHTKQAQEQQLALNHTQMFLPVRDLTKLPDQPPPPGGWLRHHLQEKYMTK